MWLIPENTRNKSAFWGVERCHEKHEFSPLFTLSFFSGFLKPGLLFAHVTFITYPYAHRDALTVHLHKLLGTGMSETGSHSYLKFQNHIGHGVKLIPFKYTVPLPKKLSCLVIDKESQRDKKRETK